MLAACCISNRRPFPAAILLALLCLIGSGAWAEELTDEAISLGHVACTPSSVPYNITIDVTNSPVSGGEVQFTMTIDPLADIDRLALTFITNGVVSLRAPLDQDLVNMLDGVPVQIMGILDMNAVGGGGMLVGSQFFETTACGEDPRTSDEFALFVLDDGVAVRTGGSSVILLEIERLEDLLDAGTITSAEADALFDALLEIEGSVESPGIVDNLRGGNVTLSGTARWTDSGGGLHPCRSVEVKAYKPATPSGIMEVATTTADANGNFSFTLSPGDLGSSPRDITVRVFSLNLATGVKTPASASLGAGAYYRQRVFADVADGATLAGSTFTANNTAVKDRAFSIADGMLVGSDYMQAVEGSRLAQITCNYPRAGMGTASFYSRANVEITIHRSKPFLWDVLLHEYGHYISHQFALDPGQGGSHSCSQDLIASLNKMSGSRLAWGEGLATYLGTAAQEVTNAAALMVPNAGDVTYHSASATSGNAWQYSNEVRDKCMGVGEGVETNGSRCLWDVADAAADGEDQVAIGHPALWTTLKGATAHNNLSDAWNALVVGKTVEEKILLGKVFSQNRVSAGQRSPADGAALAMMPPTFKWLKNKLNAFLVRFYDESFNEIGSSGELGDVAEWEPPSQAIWDGIRNGQDVVLWVVEGRNTTAPVTGRYWSGSRKLGGVDFSFVIDDTGSMSQEIGGVRDALLVFLSAFDPMSTDILFQLTTFKDSVVVRAATRDLPTIQAQVSGLGASGGGDCPEQSVGGLAAGTLSMKRGGTVLFATDADPRPGSSLPNLITQIRGTGARVNVLLSGTCPNRFMKELGTDGSSNEPGWDCEDDDSRGIGFDGAVDAYSQIASATGGTFAFVPEVNSGGDGSIEYRNASENILSASLGPRIVLVTPGELHQGSVGTLTVKGQNTTFLSSTLVAFSDGIVVNDVRVIDPVTLHVDVSVDALAALGFKDATADTASTGEMVDGLGVVRITPASVSPILVTASPSVLPRGETADLAIAGYNTNFDQSSLFAFGQGVSINSVTVVSPTSLLANVSVDAAADIGFRAAAVTTGSEVAANDVTEFFRVESEFSGSVSRILSIVPAESPLGQMVNLTLEVTGIELSPEDTDLQFSGSGITTDSVVVCDSTILASITIDASAVAGSRDVIVQSEGETAVAIDGFTVLPVCCTSNVGNVNGMTGPVTDVLFVNGGIGTGADRRVVVGTSDGILVTMEAPPSRPGGPSAYWLGAWLGEPGPTTVKTLPFLIGQSSMPTPLSSGCTPQPVKIANNIGFPEFLGAEDWPGPPTQPAPRVVLFIPGVGREVTLFLQGFILDSASPQGQIAVTNGIVIEVRD